MGEPVEERPGHLGIPENGGPFAEAEVCRDDHADVLIQLA